MTQLLTQALDAVRKLPPAEQDAIASLILDELADEQRWDKSFAQSQSHLDEIADQVRADVAAGRVLEMGIDEL